MHFRLRDYVNNPLKLWHQRRWMSQTPYFSRSEMDSLVLERLRRISTFAAKTVPYYTALFNRIGFKPEKLDRFDYWHNLPVMNKETVRSHLDNLQSCEATRLGAVWCETSGSTGTAMKFLLDSEVNVASFALFWRAWDMAPDWRIGKRQATLSGYAEGMWSYAWRTRILALSSFHLTEQNVRKYFDLIKQYGPAFLRGYPSSLYLFAKLLDQQALRLNFPVLFSGAETLLPFQRQTIEHFFNGHVIDHFTHWERTASIRECLHGNLHAENDYGYHEILRQDGTPCAPGELGRLVCTSLYNRAMPLLRYDTRDLAIWSAKQECPCGSHFPIVERIDGRIEDVVLTPDGRLVGRLDAALKYTPDIKLAQIVQPSQKEIHVNLVVDKGYDEDQDRLLLQELRKRLGQEIKIVLNKVEEEAIIRSPLGKIRFVISHVPAEQKMGHF